MDVKKKRFKKVVIAFIIVFALLVAYLLVMTSKMIDVDVRVYRGNYIIEVVNYRTTDEDNVGIRVIEQGFFNKKRVVSETITFKDTSNINRKINIYKYGHLETEIEIVNKETNEVLVRYTVNTKSDNVEIEMEKMEY